MPQTHLWRFLKVGHSPHTLPLYLPHSSHPLIQPTYLLPQPYKHLPTKYLTHLQRLPPRHTFPDASL